MKLILEKTVNIRVWSIGFGWEWQPLHERQNSEGTWRHERLSVAVFAGPVMFTLTGGIRQVRVSHVCACQDPYARARAQQDWRNQ
jgi:hypothetical protein